MLPPSNSRESAIPVAGGATDLGRETAGVCAAAVLSDDLVGGERCAIVDTGSIHLDDAGATGGNEVSVSQTAPVLTERRGAALIVTLNAAVAMAFEDARERSRAFTEKRPPRWRGR